MNTVQYKLKANNHFAILREPYETIRTHGLVDNFYVDILNLTTRYESTNLLKTDEKGMYFQYNGRHYLTEFTEDVIYIPYQTIYEESLDETSE